MTLIANRHSVNIYLKWLAANQPAELHYGKGHGFGMKKTGRPTDTWIDRFGDCSVRRLLKNKKAFFISRWNSVGTEGQDR